MEIRAWWTLRTGLTPWPPVPIFTGRVETVARARRSGLVKVTCADRFAQINDEGFEGARRAPAGVNPIAAISALIQEVYPNAAVIDQVHTLTTVPAGLAWDAGDGSRGKAVDE